MKKETSNLFQFQTFSMMGFIYCLTLLLSSCTPKETSNPSGTPNQTTIEEIKKTEAAFQAMATEIGVAEAFEFFADTAAVIKRGEPEELLKGKGKIFEYYNREVYKTAEVDWAPDYVEVSPDGNLAYSYGRYTWKTKAETGEVTEYKGIYLTIWKRQSDKSWKYIWD